MALGATPYRRDSWDAMTKTGIAFSPDEKLNSSSRKPVFYFNNICYPAKWLIFES